MAALGTNRSTSLFTALLLALLLATKPAVATPSNGMAKALWAGAPSSPVRAISISPTLVSALVKPAIATSASQRNYSDIWWNPLESGWGVTIADHVTNIFAILYAYRADGRPVWFAVPGGTFSQGRRIFQGSVYFTTGPAYTSDTFDPNLVVVTNVGSATFDFAPPGLASGIALLSYTINGVSKVKQIQPLGFGSAPPNWGVDATDLWFNPAESGWGVALAQHGNNIFGVWYTYDTDGQPLWLTLPGGTFSGPSFFSGALYRTNGPYFGSPTFDPGLVQVTQAGNASISFAGLSGQAILSTKADAECPGLSATFVATVGTLRPRLICPLPFGTLRSGPPSAPLAIEIQELPPATAGVAYSALAATASGGSPPYHYQLDSLVNGAPPLGMGIDLNGNLTGTPSAAYATSQVFSFGVCVVDVVGASNCAQASVTVNPPAPIADGSITWILGDECNNGYELDYRFFDTANNMVWPTDRTLEYYMFYGNNIQNPMNCVPGALVCYGASSNGGAQVWGLGLSGTGSCSSCCGHCDGGTYSTNLTCPGIGGGGGSFYYANWTCGSSGQCVSVMGAGAGTEGPFCSIADCQRWGNQYIPAGYSCSTTATYTPTPGGSTCYTYP